VLENYLDTRDEQGVPMTVSAVFNIRKRCAQKTTGLEQQRHGRKAIILEFGVLCVQHFWHHSDDGRLSSPTSVLHRIHQRHCVKQNLQVILLSTFEHDSVGISFPHPSQHCHSTSRESWNQRISIHNVCIKYATIVHHSTAVYAHRLKIEQCA